MGILRRLLVFLDLLFRLGVDGDKIAMSRPDVKVHVILQGTSIFSFLCLSVCVCGGVGRKKGSCYLDDR